MSTTWRDAARPVIARSTVTLPAKPDPRQMELGAK